jgi:hypothetical protein
MGFLTPDTEFTLLTEFVTVNHVLCIIIHFQCLNWYITARTYREDFIKKLFGKGTDTVHINNNTIVMLRGTQNNNTAFVIHQCGSWFSRHHYN